MSEPDPPVATPPQPAEQATAAQATAAQATAVRPTASPVPSGFGPGPAAPLHGPWPAVSVWGRRWLGPVRPASPATAAAIALAAAIAAVSVPMDRPGAGWLVTAIAGTAALVLGRVRPRRPPSMLPPPPVVHPAARLGPARFGWSAATVALLAVGTLRSAGWLFVLCLLAAGCTGTLAVAGGRSLRGMLLATLMAPAAALRGMPWVLRGLARTRGRADGAHGPRIAATVAVSVALLVVFGTLFASADAAFADLLATAVPDIDAATVTRWTFVFGMTGLILTGGAYLRAAPPDLSGLDGAGRRRVARLEWAIPLTLLVLLFGLFVAVQLAVLFGGSRHVLATDGLTYAEYARGGFWQLLVITGLTLLVLAGAARWAPRQTRADRVLIRAVLGTLAVLTLIVVASALHRMDVYADTYGLTRLRVMVAAAELWLGAVFLMVLLAGIRLRAGWLPRAAVVAAVLALLGLAAASPDGMIAERNVTRYRQTGQIDVRYLSNLSPDAVPALNRLAGLNRVRRDCALVEIHRAMREDPGDWRGWSHGREHARDLLAADPPVRHPECPTYYAD